MVRIAGLRVGCRVWDSIGFDNEWLVESLISQTIERLIG